MQTVIKHLPVKPARELHGDMTPDEVRAWLDERERLRALRQITIITDAVIVVVAAVLIYAIVSFFTH